MILLLLLLFLQLIVVIILFTCFCCICFTYSKTQLILVKLASLGFKLSIKFRMDLPPSSEVFLQHRHKRKYFGQTLFQVLSFLQGKVWEPQTTRKVNLRAPLCFSNLCMKTQLFKEYGISDVY